MLSHLKGKARDIAQDSTGHGDNSPRESSGPEINSAKAEKLAWDEED